MKEISHSCDENSHSDSSDSDEYLFQTEMDFGGDRRRAELARFLVKIDGTPLVMIADTAATCSIVDETTYRENLSHIPLRRTSTRINPYGGNPIIPIGKIRCKVKSAGKHIHDIIFVLPGNSGCLLGIRASKALGLVKIANHVVNEIKSNAADPIQRFIEEHPALVQGVGKYKRKEFELHIDKSKPPVVQKVRRLPFHTRGKVEKEIQRLLAEDIIEKAEGPTTYVSPIVVVPKKNTDEVRICVDM
ncbi:MAG: hypothetical protein MJA29_10570, partial [Candidatus Omnitrophica bacterium]|nr:hypothetical protein [Candidatus Omnitrophota bacterium]